MNEPIGIESGVFLAYPKGDGGISVMAYVTGEGHRDFCELSERDIADLAELLQRVRNRKLYNQGYADAQKRLRTYLGIFD